jgi:hypothetical protein
LMSLNQIAKGIRVTSKLPQQFSAPASSCRQRRG